MMALRPALEGVDRDQHDKGKHQEHEGNCRCFPISKLFKSCHDQHCGNLSLVREIAGYENDGAVLPQATGKAESETPWAVRPCCYTVLVSRRSLL